MNYWDRRRMIEQAEKEKIREELKKRNTEGYIHVMKGGETNGNFK